MKVKSRTRQLANGKWVLETKVGFISRWVAVDLENPTSRRHPGDSYYKNCMADTEEQAQAMLNEHLAINGI